MKTRIMLADDHGIVRQGLRLLVEQEDDLVVVGDVSDGRDAVQMAHKLLPDLVLMDVGMPDLNGIDAAVQIMSQDPDIKILILSAHNHRSFIVEALQANVSGYLLKDSVGSELISAIHAVMKGEQYLSPKVAGVVISEYIANYRSNALQTSQSMQLTSKERELIQILSEGHTTKEAARILHVSGKTVDARRRTIMEKLSINGIAELTKYAIREGLTVLD